MIMKRNGKVQILANRQLIADLITKGYCYQYIYDKLTSDSSNSDFVKYCQFTCLIKQYILPMLNDSNHTKSLLQSSDRQKPFNNDSAKIIAPTTDNHKTAKQALRDIQNDPNRTSLYD